MEKNESMLTMTEFCVLYSYANLVLSDINVIKFLI